MSGFVGDCFLGESCETSCVLLRHLLRFEERSLLGLDYSGAGLFALGPESGVSIYFQRVFARGRVSRLWCVRLGGFLCCALDHGIVVAVECGLVECSDWWKNSIVPVSVLEEFVFVVRLNLKVQKRSPPRNQDSTSAVQAFGISSLQLSCRQDNTQRPQPLLSAARHRLPL